MSELGVFAVDRGVFSHPVLDPKAAYSKREAWLWLLSQAAWKERKIGGCGTVIKLGRGQISHSIRFMADIWKWDKARVSRFLTRLKTEAMIETASEAGQTVITICNYNDYQRVALPERDTNRDSNRDATETVARQTRNIQSLKEDTLSETGVSDSAKQRKRYEYPADYLAAWDAYPTHKNMSKAQGLQQWRKLSPDERSMVAASIPEYITYLKSKSDLETIHFCRYLSYRRFEGFAETATVETEKTWLTRLGWARGKKQWSVAQWGPVPGAPGCRVPASLLVDGDGDGWADQKAA